MGQFLMAGRTDGEDAANPASGSLPGTPGLSVAGENDTDAPAFDTAMAKGLQAFMKAGQAGGEGAATNINHASDAGRNTFNPSASGEPAQGQGAEVRGSVDTYEARGPVEPDTAPNQPQPGSATERDRWNLLKGYDSKSLDYQRQQQERENWEKLKGIDPETLREHGIYWPGEGKINSAHGYRDNVDGERDENGKIKQSWHNGIDIKNTLGGTVRASEAGEVVSVAPNGSGGNTIKVKNRYGLISIYSHTAPLVKAGDRVYAGDTIGKTDMTGHTTGPHIHYGVQDKTGQFIDPQTRLPKK